MALRTMFDAVTPTNILTHDKTPDLVAGYLNGRYAWTQAEWDLFPDAMHVGISVRADFYGTDARPATVLDVEPGDATPAQSVPWVAHQRARGLRDITVYCNRSTLAQVQAAFRGARVAEPRYWIATASGSPVLYPGSAATQYLLDWQGVDVSVVADDWHPRTYDSSTGAPTQTTPAAGKDVMEPVTIPKTEDGTDNARSFRVETLTGSPTTGIIVRPKNMNADGNAPAPVFVLGIYAWRGAKGPGAGVGGNPADVAGYNPRQTSAHFFPLPGALWADVAYTCADDFDYQVVA
jgi:hypothetical protein